MSDTPVNLNKVRKARAKVARRQQAEQNAVTFGRTKAQKKADRAQAEKTLRHVDGHKRET